MAWHMERLYALPSIPFFSSQSRPIFFLYPNLNTADLYNVYSSGMLLITIIKFKCDFLAFLHAMRVWYISVAGWPTHYNYLASQFFNTHFSACNIE